jgi:hypothetical protein
LQVEDLAKGVNTISVANAAGAATAGFLNDDELFINCGGSRLDDGSGQGIGDGRVWEEDSTANPSPFLVSSNLATVDFSAGPAPSIPVADTRLTEPAFTDDPARSRLFAAGRLGPGDVVYRIETWDGYTT